MPQLTDDCFAHGGPLMTTAEALARIAEAASAVTEAETVPLRAAARRILAADVVASRAVPPHDNSAVDGYAVFFDDLNAEGETRLPVTGRIAAGVHDSGMIVSGFSRQFQCSVERAIESYAVVDQQLQLIKNLQTIWQACNGVIVGKLVQCFSSVPYPLLKHVICSS